MLFKHPYFTYDQEIPSNLILTNMIRKQRSVKTANVFNDSYSQYRENIVKTWWNYNKKLKFKSVTVYKAIYYIDLIMSKELQTYWNERELYLYALTSLILSVKYCENDPLIPNISAFVDSFNTFTNNKYLFTLNEILNAEVNCIRIINYDLGVFTLYDYSILFFLQGAFSAQHSNQTFEDIYTNARECVDNVIIKEGLFLLNYINLSHIITRLIIVMSIKQSINETEAESFYNWYDTQDVNVRDYSEIKYKIWNLFDISSSLRTSKSKVVISKITPWLQMKQRPIGKTQSNTNIKKNVTKFLTGSSQQIASKVHENAYKIISIIKIDKQNKSSKHVTRSAPLQTPITEQIKNTKTSKNTNSKNMPNTKIKTLITKSSNKEQKEENISINQRVKPVTIRHPCSTWCQPNISNETFFCDYHKNKNNHPESRIDYHIYNNTNIIYYPYEGISLNHINNTDIIDKTYIPWRSHHHSKDNYYRPLEEVSTSNQYSSINFVSPRGSDFINRTNKIINNRERSWSKDVFIESYDSKKPQHQRWTSFQPKHNNKNIKSHFWNYYCDNDTSLFHTSNNADGMKRNYSRINQYNY